MFILIIYCFDTRLMYNGMNLDVKGRQNTYVVYIKTKITQVIINFYCLLLFLLAETIYKKKKTENRYIGHTYFGGPVDIKSING